MAVLDNATQRPEVRPPVSVKGVNDGLLFLLDEQCAHEVLRAFLQELLFDNPSPLLSGPQINVSVDYGQREMTPEQNIELMRLFLQKENFTIREWSSRTMARQALFAKPQRNARPQYIHRGTVRAGQQVYYDGDVVVVGDVNPGGEIAATGDIFVFGRLRGIAHAGVRGNTQSIIAAAEFSPMQLRIAGTLTRVPEARGQAQSAFMEFAYLCEEGMAVDKLQYLFAIRPKKVGH
ncbi:septum site-determining protein MinC [Alicyclobacillus contaminans]|uniref:septum site-determining protein MinC n=1 Tax=Alicyclobacillus contaminans TaxID=392016 RepID=UPI0012EBBE95|nr:septum site-determining protein MinC [Alicyclobacillus contaminans]GMA52360.1 septum site-determining protein MinC [Alicyclobacillus contaminans]